MAWHTYAISPIDHDWDRLPLAENVAADIVREQGMEVVHTRREEADVYPGRDVGGFLAELQQAKAEARKIGWEGDYKPYALPRVFWLPDPEWFDFKCGFVWKQSNNGMTLVVSPFPLPWLAK